ncbi:AbrB family transcriptional regulator [Paenibacillus humicola]|uniref:AbrB family transcriptional regulator n=1 Tax=Paenibacillus humicola TaxID=3110540 RepID=UPI00237BEFFA|nr:AbrB family transcriptional regulator [Paenibacillus humicola]
MNGLRLKRAADTRTVRFLASLAAGIAGALVFQLIHLPIPWLLGSMISVLICSRLFKQIRPHWPAQIRNAGMIIIGYTIGLSFTTETLLQIGRQLPLMVLLTLLLMVCTVGIAAIVSFFSGIPFPTVLMGSIPGGLSQMVMLAEEMRGIDITVVTFLQVSRLMMIIITVPLLIFSPLFETAAGGPAGEAAAGTAAGWDGLFPNVLVFAAVCIVFALVLNKIKFPTAFLLGPMLATIVLHLSGFPGSALPAPFLDASQLMVGVYVGMLLKPEQLKNKVRIVLLAVVSGILLIACSTGLSLLLTVLQGVTHGTSFLSLSPGGMDQMGIIAQEVGADLSIVTCYQLFRTFFIFLAVPPILKAIFRALLRGKPTNEPA